MNQTRIYDIKAPIYKSQASNKYQFQKRNARNAIWSLLHSCFGFVCDLMLVFWCFPAAQPVWAQLSPALDGREGRNLLLENFRPKPMLQGAEHHLSRARFPVIDVHTHFRHKFHGSAEELDAWVKTMDRNNIAICVSLDGQWGDLFDE